MLLGGAGSGAAKARVSDRHGRRTGHRRVRSAQRCGAGARRRPSVVAQSDAAGASRAGSAEDIDVDAHGRGRNSVSPDEPSGPRPQPGNPARSFQLVTVGDDPVELDRSIVDELPARSHGPHDSQLGRPWPRVSRRSRGRGQARTGHGPGSRRGHDRQRYRHQIGSLDESAEASTPNILAKARRLGLVGESRRRRMKNRLNLKKTHLRARAFRRAERGSHRPVRPRRRHGCRPETDSEAARRITGRSEKGKGCSFGLRLPLTLAIIDGLVVGVGSQRYILPMFAVREMFSPGPRTHLCPREDNGKPGRSRAVPQLMPVDSAVTAVRCLPCCAHGRARGSSRGRRRGRRCADCR